MSTLTPVRPVPGSPRNGMPERRNYVYRGLGYDTLTPWMDDGCYCGGNKDAYRAHLQVGEEPCGRSRAAHKASALAAARRAEGRQP